MTGAINFNFKEFMSLMIKHRHARLWQDHAFSSSSLDYQEVRRQMVMFVTMYSMIDRDMFAFMPRPRAENEWNRVWKNKEAFLEDTLTWFAEHSACETSWIGSCRNFYGSIECEQCLFIKDATKTQTTINVTTATTTTELSVNVTQSVGLHHKVATKSKELFQKSKQWTVSVFSSQLTTNLFLVLIFLTYI